VQPPRPTGRAQLARQLQAQRMLLRHDLRRPLAASALCAAFWPGSHSGTAISTSHSRWPWLA
jgi:hypothetical protein